MLDLVLAGMTYRRIAEEMGISLGKVAELVKEGRESIPAVSRDALYGAVSSKSVRLSANDQTLVPGIWPLSDTGGVVCRFNEPGTSALMKKELAST